jgi:hypothetical protein
MSGGTGTTVFTCICALVGITALAQARAERAAGATT